MAEVSQRARGPLVYRGVGEICAACGLNAKKMSRYVDVFGMPAFKVDGAWVALPGDLLEWLEGLRDKALGSTKGTKSTKGE